MRRPSPFKLNNIRTVLDRKGNTLYRALDLCRQLEFNTMSTALKNYVTPQHIIKELVKSRSKRKSRVYVTEPGVYELVLGAQTPEATEFKSWLTVEVVPELSKRGCYRIQTLRESMVEIERELEELDRQNRQSKADRLKMEGSNRVIDVEAL